MIGDNQKFLEDDDDDFEEFEDSGIIFYIRNLKFSLNLRIRTKIMVYKF